MKTYSLTTFNTHKSPINGESELTWDEIVDLFTQGHRAAKDKNELLCFNGARFKSLDEVIDEDRDGYVTPPWDSLSYVRRKKQNLKTVELLIIDYDGGVELDEARSMFKEYRYLGYTSFRHLYDGKTHKFRLIFPLSEPIPASIKYDSDGRIVGHDVYHDLIEAIGDFAPGSDPSAYNHGTQLFFIPSAPSERIHLSQSWHNEGKILDWSEWKVTDRSSRHPTAGGSSKSDTSSNSKRLDPDQEFHHKYGVILAKDVDRKIEEVTCPFHDDRKGSAFLNIHDSGIVSFYCWKCKTFSLPPITTTTQTSTSDTPRNGGRGLSDLVEYDEDENWVDHEDRALMSKFLSDIKKNIESDTGKKKLGRHDQGQMKAGYKFKSHILYFPEGSGKSQLALTFLTNHKNNFILQNDTMIRHQIIFACKSWKQVIEQYSTFLPKLQAIGRTARVAWSFDGAIQRRFNVKIRRNKSEDFRPGDIIEQETMDEIIKTNPKLPEHLIRLTWNILSDTDRFSQITTPDVVSVEPVDGVDDTEDFFHSIRTDPVSMIFTTFEQLRLLKSKKDNIPKNWMIWFDDPDVNDLIDIKPVVPSTRKIKKERPVIDGTTYNVREEGHSFGLQLKDHRCIYTTTERLTVKKLEHLFKNRGEEYELHGERFSVTGGKVTILGTKAVQKKYDALVSLLVRRINQINVDDILLIADGIPSELNHTTNKGRNDLTDRNIVVELSYPHPVNVKTICDSMGLDFNTYRDEISKDLMVDKLHQAVGRNTGFRWNGREAVVLVDKNRHEYIVKECRYSVDKINSQIIDRTEKMSRKEKRITDTASPLVKQIEELINNPHPYFSDSRKIKPDIKFVVTSLPDNKSREDYLIRLLDCLTSYSKVRFDRDSPSDSQSGKVWKLGRWILDEYGPEIGLSPLLERYKRGFES